jgi:hypothetical protein
MATATRQHSDLALRLGKPTADAVSGELGREGGAWRRDMLGQLRLDSLISETLVVPDSYVLDGRFFLSFSPGELRESLGRDFGRATETRHLPLEIPVRGGSLKASLAHLLRHTGRSTLNPFVFSTLGDP